jgi:antirestriction protein ArdC
VRATPEEREAKLRALHDTLTRQVETLTTSEGWMAMLHAAARFPQYSPSNVLLITAQRPDATHVAGIRTWNALGRHVRRGEKGIAILAPRLAGAAPAEGAATDPWEPVDPLVGARLLRGFLVVHVFDVAQTDGQPLPVVEPQLLEGDVPPGLWDRLAQVAETEGYALERGSCGGANGWTDFTRRVIRVRGDVSARQACKTLAHEVGHAMADHEHRFTDLLPAAGGCRGTAEVEAESIAYLVLASQGVPTEDYSVPYVAGWAEGHPHVVRLTMETSLSTARRISDQLGNEPDATRSAASTGSPAAMVMRTPGVTQPVAGH